MVSNIIQLIPPGGKQKMYIEALSEAKLRNIYFV